MGIRKILEKEMSKSDWPRGTGEGSAGKKAEQGIAGQAEPGC